MISAEAIARAREIEIQLCRYLGIPDTFWVEDSGGRELADRNGDFAEPARPEIRSFHSQDLTLQILRFAVSELEQKAAAIGRVPVGYPKHLDLIMRGLSALLPWYTRGLRDFGAATVDVCRALTAVVEEMEKGRQGPHA